MKITPQMLYNLLNVEMDTSGGYMGSDRHMDDVVVDGRVDLVALARTLNSIDDYKTNS